MNLRSACCGSNDASTQGNPSWYPTYRSSVTSIMIPASVVKSLYTSHGIIHGYYTQLHGYYTQLHGYYTQLQGYYLRFRCTLPVSISVSQCSCASSPHKWANSNLSQRPSGRDANRPSTGQAPRECLAAAPK